MRPPGLDPDKAMPRLNLNTQLTQPRDPSPQQRRSFHLLGINPAATCLKGFDAKPPRPFTKSARVEFVQQVSPKYSIPAVIARDEFLHAFAMREIQTALARNEELATKRWHRIENRDRHPTHRGDFRRAKPGRTSADHGHLQRPLCCRLSDEPTLSAAPVASIQRCARIDTMSPELQLP